ncbi:MAG: translocation/assembly module TamB domain-containing protein [Bacteroidales bacterium]
MNRVARGVLRWMLRILMGLILLFLLILLALQLPAVQTTLVNKITGTIAERTGAEINLDHVGIRFPKAISIGGLYAEDLQGDTLIYADELQVDLRLTALLRKRIDVNRIRLSGATINMTRLQPDSLFNYAAILQKLSGNQAEQGRGSGNTREEQDTNQGNWDFNVRDVVLEHIRFRFADHFSGIDLRVRLQDFRTRLDELNPDFMQYHTGTIHLGELSVELKTFERSVPAEPRAANDRAGPLDLAVRQLLADHISFRYEDESGFFLFTEIKALDVIPDLIDLENSHYALERFLVDEWTTEMRQPSGGTTVSAETQPRNSVGESPDSFVFRWDEVMPVSVTANLIHLSGINFFMQELPAPVNPGDTGFDPANFRFSDADLLLEDLRVSPDTLAMELKHLSGKESGGLSLRKLAAGIAFGDDSRLENFSLETGESMLRGGFQTSVSLLELPSQIPGDHLLDIRFPEGKVGPDLLPFIPQLVYLFQGDLSSPVNFGLVARGRVNDLRLDTLYATIPAIVNARFQGSVRGLPDSAQLFADLPEISLEVNPQSFLAYVPDSLHPKGVEMPDTLQLSGSFKGRPSDFAAEAGVSMDSTALSASMNYKQEDDRPLWDASLELVSAQPLAMIGQGEMIRDISATFEATGKGFDPATMDLDMEGRVDSVWYSGYVYRGLDMNAMAEEGRIQLRMDYEDEHLAFDLTNDVNFGDSIQSVLLDFQLAHLNARALGLTEEMVAVQTRLSADLDFSKDDDFPLGSLRLQDTYLLLDREVFSLDSLLIRSARTNNQYSVEISSPLMNGHYSGNISPAGIPDAVTGYLGTYFEEEEDSEREYANFEMALQVNSSPFISELLLPQMTSYEPFDIVAEFNGRERHFFVDADIPDMHFAGVLFEEFSARIDSDPDGLNFNVDLPLLETGDIRLSNVGLGGKVRDQRVSFDLSFDDRHADNWLRLSGQVRQQDTLTEVMFDRSALINRQEWQIEPDHFLRFGGSVLLAENLRMRNEEKLFALQSDDPADPESPLEFIMENIDLGAFDLIGGSPLVKGLLNGHITVDYLPDSPTFTAGLTVDQMGFGKGTFGDVDFEVENQDPGLFDVTASVRGYGSRVDLQGSYRVDDPPGLDFQLELASLELSPLEPLTSGGLTNMQGNISGQLELTGNPSDPEIQGNIGFQDVGFHVVFLNVAYTIPEETIVFDQQQVSFDQFSLYDTSDREATLDGYVDFSVLSDPRFNLSLSSRDFMALDLPKGENELFYGRLLIDTDLSMRAHLSEPVIDGQLALNQGSDFSFIVPQTAPEAIGDEGIVEFVSPQDDVFTGLAERETESEPIVSPFQNLDLSVNVEIDPQTTIRIVLDEVAGDQLEARGGGQITYGIDPGGRINFAGRYELTGGAYNLTFYDVIQRNFQIQRGGQVIWTGDPLEADVDITAVYTVRTSPAELMLSHGVEQPEQDRRRQYPFEVYLNMEGGLMQPEISFAIRLPQEHQGAMDGRLQARLNELNQNESELNKQVFALLIIGNFIQDDPLASVGAGPGLSSSARSSASSILSRQLNRLSDRYIKGMDINFDLASYEAYDEGQVTGRTELQMEVSRDFLDERLRITAGGNIELEDETRRQVNPSDIAGDFSAEYLLTPGGRFTIKGYRERKYEDIYDGELVETGISLIFRQTYNSFRELFMRKEDEVQSPGNNE